MSDTMLFKTFCIEQYKLAHYLSGKDVTDLFFQYGVMDYLQSFYDVLHSTGAQYFVEDIDFEGTRGRFEAVCIEARQAVKT